MTNQHDLTLQGKSGESKAGCGWSEHRTERLRSLWALGKSGGEIAADLGGVTRNAVIGKVHRLGLSGRATTTRMTRRREQVRKTVEKAEKSTVAVYRRLPPRIRDMNPAHPSMIRDPHLDIPRVAFADLEPHHCRWPVGDPTQGFCGCAKHPGTPYCQAHGERAYGVRVDMIPGVVAGTIKHDNATHAAVTEFLEAVA